MNRIMQTETERLKAVFRELADNLLIISKIPENGKDSDLINDLINNEGKPEAADALQTLWGSERVKSKSLRADVRKFLRTARNDNGVFSCLSKFAEKDPAWEGKNEGKEAGSGMDGFVSAMEYVESMVLRKMELSVDQEKLQREMLEGVRDSLERSKDDRENLTNALSLIRDSKEKDLETLDAKIKGLKGELSYLVSTTNSQGAELEKESSARSSAMIAAHEESSKKLDEEQVKLKTESKTSEEERLPVYLASRKAKKNATREIQEIMREYDEKMFAIDKEREEINVKYKVEKAELQKLEEYFDKWDAERARIAEEERIIEEELAKQRAAQKVLDDAAATIQAQYRGGKARADVAKLKKKAKKKAKK
eukprot:g4085.t1